MKAGKYTIYVGVVDLWPIGGETHGVSIQYLLDVIKFAFKDFNVEITNDPEKMHVVLCSIFGNRRKMIKQKNPNVYTIMYMGESHNVEKDFPGQYDTLLGFDYEETDRNKNIRVPLYMLHHKYEPHMNLEQSRDKNAVKQILAKKKPDKFCCFLVSNGSPSMRLMFYDKLSAAYKKIDSAGNVRNNHPKISTNLQKTTEFISQYKFMITFENTEKIGYTTEKLTNAWNAGTVPIYWGNKNVHLDFNTKAFINCHDKQFANQDGSVNFDKVIEYIKRVDQDDQLYQDILSQPLLHDGVIQKRYLPQTVGHKLYQRIVKHVS